MLALAAPFEEVPKAGEIQVVCAGVAWVHGLGSKELVHDFGGQPGQQDVARVGVEFLQDLAVVLDCAFGPAVLAVVKVGVDRRF